MIDFTNMASFGCVVIFDNPTNRLSKMVNKILYL
jgi:hypothetical protein